MRLTDPPELPTRRKNQDGTWDSILQGEYGIAWKDDEIGNYAIAEKMLLQNALRILIYAKDYGDDMVNINEAFPSDYLKAADLQNRRIKLVIESVRLEVVGEKEKPVVYFKHKDKGLVLNKTNAGTLQAMYGPETDDWIDQKCVLFPSQVMYEGKMVPAIRVEPELEEPEGEEKKV